MELQLSSDSKGQPSVNLSILRDLLQGRWSPPISCRVCWGRGEPQALGGVICPQDSKPGFNCSVDLSRSGILSQSGIFWSAPRRSSVMWALSIAPHPTQRWGNPPNKTPALSPKGRWSGLKQPFFSFTNNLLTQPPQLPIKTVHFVQLHLPVGTLSDSQISHLIKPLRPSIYSVQFLLFNSRIILYRNLTSMKNRARYLCCILMVI